MNKHHFQITVGYCPAVALALLLSSAAPAAAQSPLSSQPYVTGLTQPIAFVQDPSRPNIQYVAQQNGVVRVIDDGTLRAQPFLDLLTTVLNGGEQGFLGFLIYRPSTIPATYLPMARLDVSPGESMPAT